MSDQKPICKVSSDGAKEWYLNGKLHRVDGPAIEWADGSKEWLLNGKLHRADGPACEYVINGRKYWYLNSKLCKPIEVFKAATHEQQIHMLCFHASEFMP
jgi:hypothetical protein